jgi:hypothetical protein
VIAIHKMHERTCKQIGNFSQLEIRLGKQREQLSSLGEQQSEKNGK